MATLLEQAGNAASQWAKEQLCSGGGFLLDNLPAIGPGGRAAREVARGIHGGICGLPTPPELGEPTPGTPEPGQCLTAYIVTIETLERNRIDCSTRVGGTIIGLPGPVSGPTLAGPGQVVCGDGGTLPGRIDATFGFPPITGPVYSPAGGGNWLIESITRWDRVRNDGLPDDCGEPGDDIPPPPPPPIPVPPDIDLPVTPPDGGPDIDFNFSPRVGPIFIGGAGGLFIPVNVRINGPNINVNAPISVPVNISLPDFNISFPGQGGGGGAPDDPSAPVPPGPPPRPVPGPPRPVCCDPPLEPGPEIDEDEDEAPPVTPQGRRLVGVLVRCSIISSAQNVTEVGQGGGELNLYVPRLANIYFTVAADNIAGLPQTASSEALPVQLLRQFIPAPEGVFVRTWRAVAEPGIRVVATPLYVPANRV